MAIDPPSAPDEQVEHLVTAGRKRAQLVVQKHTGTLVDRALLAIMKRQQASPLPGDFERISDEISQTHDHYSGLGLIGTPGRFHQDPGLLRMQLRKGWFPGVPHEVMRFDSGYQVPEGCFAGTRFERLPNNGTARAFVARHKDPSRPWLVCLHGLGCGERWMDFRGFRVAHLHQTLGLNVVCPVLPLHGTRRPPGATRGELVSKELLQTLHGIGQAVHDVRAVMAWIRQQGGSQIGLYGLSFGAYVAAVVAGLEPVDLVLAGIPLVDIPDLFENHMTPDIRETAERFALTGERLRDLFDLVSPLSFHPQVEHGGRFIFAGSGDSITGPAQARALWEHWERPSLKWYSDGHVGFFWSRAVPRYVNEVLVERGFCVPRVGPDLATAWAQGRVKPTKTEEGA